MQLLLTNCADRLLDILCEFLRIERYFSAEQTLDTGCLAAAEVALGALGPEHLAGTTDVEPLLGTLVGLHLRHVRKFPFSVLVVDRYDSAVGLLARPAPPEPDRFI